MPARTDWMKVGTDVVVGGAIGAGDQLIQNADDRRTPVPGIMGRFGTYYNYGLPILAIAATAFGLVSGNMATRLVTAGAQLAGRKMTKQFTRVTSAAWHRQPAPSASPAASAASVGIEF